MKSLHLGSRPPVAAVFSALSLAALLASCWSPYYDPKVSNSVPLYKKLGSPFLSIGPVSDTSGMSDPQAATLEFLPTRPSLDPLDPLDGFLVQRGSDSIKVAFVESYNGSYRLAPTMQSMSNMLGSAALIRAEAAKGTSPQLVLIANKVWAAQCVFTPTIHSLMMGSGLPFPGGISTLGFGASLLMPPATDTDTYAALYADGAQVFAAMAGIGADLSPIAPQVDAGLDTGGRSLVAGGTAFQDIANHRFYYSEPGGPTLLWDTTTWPASSKAPAELPIPERLTAMLSDGTLVAQGDTYLTAYSAGGKKLFSIPAGSVRLEHEVYFPGASPAAGNYLIFSQVLSVRGGIPSRASRVWGIEEGRLRFGEPYFSISRSTSMKPLIVGSPA
jgi:hypothetical protein